MIGALSRKLRQVGADPVLRRWLLRRLTGRTRSASRPSRQVPPYLAASLPLSSVPNGPAEIAVREVPPPTAPIKMNLGGEEWTVRPEAHDAIFETAFEDIETMLALHRFAWLPLQRDAAGSGWLDRLWSAWVARYADPSDEWPWHPYTAAERAINIIDFVEHHGLPRADTNTLDILARHGPAIAERLEYFGETYTGNHLANNGRGLYRLGLFLDWPACTEIGLTILLKEAARIFTSTGMLREGSSHYHLLLAKNYADVWLAARRHARAEEPELRAIVGRALAAVPVLMLPGGMPRIGDISPDCPPDYLACMYGERHGWLGGLSADDQAAFLELRAAASSAVTPDLGPDGWHRGDFGDWSVLAHCAPQGWPPMPGHGHQDCASFELHHKGVAIVVDSGRGRYGDTHPDAGHVGARFHNGITIDGADPYPTNRPYYGPEFRAEIAGPRPAVRTSAVGIDLRFHGFSRLAGVGAVERSWRFAPDKLVIADRIEGSRTATVTRRLFTTQPTRIEGDKVHIRTGDRIFAVTCDSTEVTTSPARCWSAYACAEPATEIRFTTRPRLPWASKITIETA